MTAARMKRRALFEELLADPRVRTAAIPNGGTGVALNHGLGLASGEYIAFLDADDEYFPNHLSSHLEVMRQRPDIDLLWGGLEVVAAKYEDTLVPDVERGTGLIPVSQCVVQGTLFGRRDLFLKQRFTEDRSVWWQDYEFVKRIRGDYKVERFSLMTYRYYRDSGQSVVDRIKAGWDNASDKGTAI